MKKALTTLALGATIAISAVANPTAAEARWHRGFPVAPVVGGLAAGALLGAALAPRPVVYEPVYYGPPCVVRRERFWDGWSWHFRRVEDCY
jgi:hypothetical protein